MKDDRGREDDRENGTNGDDRKGLEDTPKRLYSSLLIPTTAIDSPPPPAHDELDTAE
jgi:hypothetical protein